MVIMVLILLQQMEKNLFFFSRLLLLSLCVAPIACLHFDVNIRDIDHMLCGKELVSIFVLAYFANQNC